MLEEHGDQKGPDPVKEPFDPYQHLDVQDLGRRPDQERVRSILLVSTPYDQFLLEEEGRLIDHFRESYIGHGCSFIPYIDHAASGEEALSIIGSRTYDLIIAFNPPPDMDIVEFGKRTREISPEGHLGFLASDTPEIRRIYHNNTLFDVILTWSGDGTILETMVRMVEDLDMDHSESYHLNRGEVLIAGEDVGDTSRALEIFSNVNRDLYDYLIGDDASIRKRQRLSSRLPRPVITGSFSDAVNITKDRRRRVLGIIVFGPLDDKGPFSIPIIQIIKGPAPEKKENIRTVRYREDNVDRQIDSFLREIMIPGDLACTPGCSLKGEIRSLRSLDRSLRSSDNPSVCEVIDRGSLIDWLLSQLEFEIAEWVSRTYQSDGEITTDLLRTIIYSYRNIDKKGAVLSYSRNWPSESVRVMRIGKGPMGGKARGLAFMDRMINRTEKERFKGSDVGIPRMVIICTDMFSEFMEQNHLLDRSLLELKDERISERFLAADLPSTLTGDLMSIVRSFKGPLSVRSSSLLEDAIFQPFAGVYSSAMVPNNDPSEDKRFQDLARAVKFVYSSTYFKGARDYIRTTNNRLEEERMGVIIQEISGQRHGELFYPNISGVARSYDFWPLPGCDRKDGTVSLAIGLGKTIVDGMGAWKFSPARPEISLFNDTKELMDSTQRKFYAVDLGAGIPRTHPEEGSTLSVLDLEVALSQGTADLLVSTLDPGSDRFYPGPFRDGPKVVDYSPILKEGMLPLPEVIREVMDIGQEALGGPVEIEFTVNIDNNERRISLDILQIRSMVARWGSTEHDIEPDDDEVLLLRSKRVLGNGMDRSCRDIVFVTDPQLDLSISREVSKEISSINRELLDEERPYILIGPGRWGSSDPWLGIPLNWSDVSGAKAIVETPVSGRMIDPSQGSHFFQNMSSLKRCYFTVPPSEADRIPWDTLAGLGKVDRRGHLTHIGMDQPLTIRIDGKSGEGTISARKPGKSS
ncbi:MAG: PEP/pyruvate-binding domain-containing protein [Thermoplasmatota archaeon]